MMLQEGMLNMKNNVKKFVFWNITPPPFTLVWECGRPNKFCKEGGGGGGHAQKKFTIGKKKAPPLQHDEKKTL